MPHIADVVANTPITATWGNLIRDHVVAVFDSAAQRTSQWAAPPNGALSYLLDQPGRLWIRQSGAWVVLVDRDTLTVITSQSAATQDGTTGTDFTYNSATITLTPGTWLVQAAAGCINLVVVDATAVGLWNQTTAGDVPNSVGVLGYTSTVVAQALWSLPTVIVVAAPTVVRPRIRRAGASAVRVFGGAGAPAAWISGTLIRP